MNVECLGGFMCLCVFRDEEKLTVSLANWNPPLWGAFDVKVRDALIAADEATTTGGVGLAGACREKNACEMSSLRSWVYIGTSEIRQKS